jgi:DNA-binding transcriptional regulator YbjK
MRYLRWKRNYFSGFIALDRPKQSLYEELQELQQEMEHKEHCQDMDDLMQELKQEARNLFEAKAASCSQAEALMTEHSAMIEHTLTRHLPLTALDTPACRDCDVCAHTDLRMHEWLMQARSPQMDEKEDAA